MKSHLDRGFRAVSNRASCSYQQLINNGWGRFLLAAGLLGAGYLAWAINLNLHRDWADIIAPAYRQVFAPSSGFLTLDLRGASYAIFAWLLLFLTGVLATELLLPGEVDRWLKRLTVLLTGFGLVGTLTTLLAAFFQLNLAKLCAALITILLLLLASIAFVSRGEPLGSAARLSLMVRLKGMLGVWKFSRADFSGTQKRLLVFLCLLSFAIMEYQALRFPEFDWDALIYHANMAKIMFVNGGVPVIAGPSAGLELSANYPPLYSALGAYFYVFCGLVNDTYLRMLSPVFSMLTLFCVYKIGSEIGDARAGAVAAVLLLLTPLYFSRSLYATNYLAATTFLTAALLFLIKWFHSRQNRYWPAFGLMLGFALLTSVHALLFLPSILILFFISYRWMEKEERERKPLYALAALALAFSIYSIWLVRNTLYVHNPIYPFGSQWIGGLHFDQEMFQSTVSAIRKDSIFNYFGTYTPTIPVYLQRLLANRSQFPVLSLLVLLGAGLIPFDRNRREWTLTGLYILPVGLLFASTLINIFPRYFVLILPECALLVGLLFSKILAWGDFGFVSMGPKGRLRHTSLNAATHALAGILIGLMFVFPGNLGVVLGKQYGEADIYKPNYWAEVPGSQDVYATLAIAYGQGVRAWEWLQNKATSSNERIASFENRTYYLTDDVTSMFYLDGWEAKPLYQMTDPAVAYAYLKENRVKYLLDAYWAQDWEVYQMLPINWYLGHPEYFPLLVDTPEAKIYQVGRVVEPFTSHSPLAINLSPEGWGSPEVEELYWSRSVEKNTSLARIFVAPAERITLSVIYLDAGTGMVDFNVKKPDGAWDYSTQLRLTNTGQWLVKDLELPRVNVDVMVEIGVFCETSDFIVNHLSARNSE